MRMLLVLLAVLVAAPVAAADSVVYASSIPLHPTVVASVALDGRGARTLAFDRVLAFSPDGRDAVRASDKSLYLTSIDGTGERLLATVSWEIDEATFSPDGKAIAFTAVSTAECAPSSTGCATWELWLVRVDGTSLRRLNADARFPRFSPDGKRIAYQNRWDAYDDGGHPAVETLATHGRIQFSDWSSVPPAWAPDSDRIAYTRQGDGRLRVATLATRRVSDLGFGGGAVFSPRGTSVAYASRGRVVVRTPTRARVIARGPFVPRAWTRSGVVVLEQRRAERGDLYAIGAAGGRLRRLTRTEGTTSFDVVAVRGRRVLYEAVTTSIPSQLFAVSPAGGTPRRLTHDAHWYSSPSASAATGGLVLARRVPPSETVWELAAARADGSGIRRIVGPGPNLDPVQAIDGRIAFTRFAPGGSDIWTATPGGAAVQLTHFGGLTSTPTFSPDGTRVAFASNGGGVGIYLWVVDAAGGTPVRLGQGQAPAWSPDGRAIAFLAAGPESRQSLAVLELATGGLRTLAPAFGARPAWSPDGSRIAYVQHDVVHVIGRDGSGDTIVALHAAVGGSLAWVG